eukprot:15342769-Ditylum_brightwellii.AAC.1
MLPQVQGANSQNQVNNVNLDANSNGQATAPTAQQPPTAQESNQIRAANFLQLSNRNYVVRNTTSQLSSHMSDRMSVQSYQQQSNYKGNLWIDSRTNISAMGRSFKMIEELGHKANMTGFANDLVKNNIPIGSGLTKCVNKATGFQFLLGLHEAPYLEDNKGSLLSTNQPQEAGIWLADVLKQHGGDQRLVTPVENSEEMLDMQLEVKDGLLAIECAYPSDSDLTNLPR